MSSPDLTGRWVGHYCQQGREYPNTADFTQSGEHLSGSMRDGRPDRECTVFEAAAAAGLPPGADEQIEARLRAMVPDRPSDPIRYVSHLPDESIVEGRCTGRTVRFLKTYRGTAFGGYRVGDVVIGVERADHAVHYEGRLGDDGPTIAGRWWIDADPASGARRTEGAFLLRGARGGEVPGEPPGPASGGRRRPRWQS